MGDQGTLPWITNVAGDLLTWLAVIAGAVALIIYVVDHFVVSLRLIRLTLHWRTRWGRIESIWTWIRLAALLRRRPTLRDVRILVELAILVPRDSLDATQRAEWWRRTLKSLLKDARQEPSPESGPDAGAIIHLPTCFAVHSALDDAERYFKRLIAIAGDHRLSEHEARTFVTGLVVEQGFVAPLHLLRGLLIHFDEQWGPMIDMYGVSMSEAARAPAGSPRAVLSPVQLAQWNTWLMWGPSVPLCPCPAWTPLGAASTPVAWQFGYGDENNSVPLFLSSDETAARFLDELTVISGASAERDTPLADQVKVHGRLVRADRADAKRRLADAQASTASIAGVSAMLEYQKIESVGARSPVARRRYYSAYLWVLFWMTDEHNTPIWSDPAQSWRNVLPFFVHANIAEDDAYAYYKRVLATIAVDAIDALGARLDPAHIRFHYACAIDHANCGWTAPDAEPAPDRCLVSTRQGSLIHDAIREAAAYLPAPLRACVRLPADDSYDPSVVLGDDADATSVVGCHLHELIERYVHEAEGHHSH